MRANYDCKDALKAAGCSWDARGRVWYREVPLALADDVASDFVAIHSGITPVQVGVDALDRYG